MANYVIWLDSEKAHLFHLTTGGIKRSHVEKKTVSHHTHDKSHNHADPAVERFFHELAEKLTDAADVLLMGPGLAKNHFKTHLEKHHHENLAKKIVGIENCDHPTDNQIIATSKKFFQKYDLYHHPIA